MKNYHPLHQSQLYRVQTRRKLAAIFSLTEPALQAILAHPGKFSDRYIELTRNGVTKKRHVQEPRGPLRPIHDRVRKLLSRIEPPPFLYCPVKRRSYVTNAALHVGSKEIRTLDVAKYFPSTPRHRVYWFFRSAMQCNTDVASILAELLTADGHLATGSTVSPILSYYAFQDMWLQIAKLVDASGCKLSVYMDDVTVSGDQVPEHLMWEIRKQIYSRGLKYHKEKRYQNGVGEITGVVVRKQDTVVPNRQRKKVYELKALLRETKDIDLANSIRRTLTGLSSQQKQVERRL